MSYDTVISPTFLHGTSKASAEIIIAKGFDLNATRENSAQEHGPGIYVVAETEPEIASMYSSRAKDGGAILKIETEFRADECVAVYGENNNSSLLLSYTDTMRMFKIFAEKHGMAKVLSDGWGDYSHDPERILRDACRACSDSPYWCLSNSVYCITEQEFCEAWVRVSKYKLAAIVTAHFQTAMGLIWDTSIIKEISIYEQPE